MSRAAKSPQSRVPSVDAVLKSGDGEALVAAYGHHAVTDAVRDDLAALRQRLAKEGEGALDAATMNEIIARVAGLLERLSAPSLKPVFNLTGTVLHTNLGRAPLPPEAIEAVAAVARGASNLEYELASGRPRRASRRAGGSVDRGRRGNSGQ